MTFFKRFRFQTIFRILLFSASIGVFFYFILYTKLYTTILVMGFVILYQVYALIRFVEKTNQHLSRFFQAVKYDDFSQSFTGKELGASYRELVKAFNEVMDKVRQTRSEKEEHYRYLQTIVHHVGIGLIAFKADGSVDLINTAAKRLLRVARLKNIRSLNSFSRSLVDTLFSLKAGEKALVKIDDQDMELALHAAEFRLKDQKYILVSLQNIQSELQEKEMEAWQTLIRVLTHEIMNSMTPITSMAATVIDLLHSLEEKNQETMDAEYIADISAALKTIHKRSLGLTDFVTAYRNLTLIPKPKFKIFPISELFSRIEKLMENKLTEKSIGFQWCVDPQSLELTADPGLIEQVLINLILNAAEALDGTKNTRDSQIRLNAVLDDTGKVIIRVTDNGRGIVKEALSKVFIPFYSTKKKGSGIGLSLSRQIMKLHKGSITVHSDPDVETVFTLKF
ncbi:MAG: GHKL domain-containing protein [Candidatus Aminicenantes bacterium]|nr:MAG: GHKL domain-containing protein [Candidatus Aminicenantes bacterium]